MNLSRPAAAKSIGMTEQSFNLLVGEMHMVPIQYHRAFLGQKRRPVSMPYYSKAQIAQVLAAHRKQIALNRERSERRE